MKGQIIGITKNSMNIHNVDSVNGFCTFYHFVFVLCFILLFLWGLFGGFLKSYLFY